MMAQKRSTLNMPRFEMVKDPPVNSCGCSLFARALAANSRTCHSTMHSQVHPFHSVSPTNITLTPLTKEEKSHTPFSGLSGLIRCQPFPTSACKKHKHPRQT